MGRLLKSEIGSRFVSANLPMLHRRTVENTGRCEFRPGIVSAQDAVDLCGSLSGSSTRRHAVFAGTPGRPRYPGEELAASVVAATLEGVRAEMRRNTASSSRPFWTSSPDRVPAL